MDKFPEQLEKLYKNEYYRLYMKAVNELGDFFLAEDVVEEVFVAIIRHNRWWSGISEKDRINYAEKMCSIICREFRKKRDRFKHVAYKDDVEERDEYQINAELRLIEREAMLQNLDNLDKEDKEIFLEKYFDGMSIKNIACLHGLTEANVTKRLQRGRRRLKGLVK